MAKKIVLFIFFAHFMASLSIAQSLSDSIPSFDLAAIRVFPQYKIEGKKEARNFERLNEDLRKIYPLVEFVSIENERINKEMQLYNDDRQIDFLKWYEKYAKEHYMPLIAGLNARQVRLLLLLIDRELEQSPYELVKTYRTGFRAVFWQGVAIMYFANLKKEYDPEANPMIEYIIRRIKAESLSFN